MVGGTRQKTDCGCQKIGCIGIAGAGIVMFSPKNPMERVGTHFAVPFSKELGCLTE
jgi:hypothetical protein